MLPFFEEAYVGSPNRYETYGAPGAETLEHRAEEVLTERLGEGEETSVVSASACGSVAVQADQTHYSDGFALLLPLQQRVAVALRPTSSTESVVAARERAWSTNGTDWPSWVELVWRILDLLFAGEEQGDVALVSTVPGVCRDGYLAGLAVALVRAAGRHHRSAAFDLDNVKELRDTLIPELAKTIAAVIDRPYSEAPLLAAFAGNESAFTLVDTSTREHLPVETEARTALHWAVLDPSVAEPKSSTFHHQRREQAETALRKLRTKGFEGIKAFRDLEHRDLEKAVGLLPPELQPVVRHLVTENRRVQKHVAAMRRADWQMIGALLLMSHASLRDEWESTHASADALVEEAETLTHHGIYGAAMTERSGAVLVTGRPSSFRQGLRHLKATFEAQQNHPLRILRP